MNESSAKSSSSDNATRRSSKVPLRIAGVSALALGLAGAGYGLAGASASSSTAAQTATHEASLSVTAGPWSRRDHGGPPKGGGTPPGAFGTVASVNGSSTTGLCGISGAAGSFTVTAHGPKASTTSTTDTVEVTTTTTFKDPGVSSASFANLCVGDHVAAVGTTSSSTITATSVMVLPPGKGGPPKGGGTPPGAFGTVASVNGSSTTGLCGISGAAGSFTVTAHGPKASTTSTTDTVEVTTTTTFKDPGVSSASFANLCVGDHVAAVGTTSSSTITATSVMVLPPGKGGPPKGGGTPPGAFGTVASVNGSSTTGLCGISGAAGSFTVTAHGPKASTTSTTDTVEVTTTTTFKDPGVSSASFANLCVGDHVAAVGTTSSSTITATSVMVLPPGKGGPGPMHPQGPQGQQRWFGSRPSKSTSAHAA